jgi:hypothetical protein
VIKIYKTTISTLVLYKCGTYSLTLNEEHTLMVSENRVLRRIFVPKRYEVRGGWRMLYNEELDSLSCGNENSTHQCFLKMVFFMEYHSLHVYH